MVTISKSRAIRERTRLKYVRVANRSNALARERRLNIRKSRLVEPRLKQKQLAEADKQKLMSEIQKERHPDKLKEKMEKARKEGMDAALMAKDKERLEKMEKAREHLQEAIKRMKHRSETSHIEKEAMESIRMGQSDTAMRAMKESGREGAVGNDVAGNETVMAREMQTLAKEAGKHTDSVMQKLLRENSVPADSYVKKSDKSDRNLEEKQTQDSTVQQMVQKKMFERRMRGAA